MSIEQLDVLVGSWRLTGRTPGAEQDDISGDLHAEPILGGNVLRLTGTTRVGTFELPGLELIWAEPDGTFGSHVYTSSGPPLVYRWSRDGSTLVHSGLGATYRGTIGEDGSTITGGWRPDPGEPLHPGSNYDATMIRVA